MATDPKLLSVRETATLLRLGRDATYRLVRARRIPAIRLGKNIRIPRRELLDLIAAEAARDLAV